MPLHLFYIHGFNSSPQSVKARLMGDYLRSYPLSSHPQCNDHALQSRDLRYHVPALPYDPEQAIAILAREVERCLPDPVGLLGSSLGGFYGTWVAERYGLPLVLVNPAVRPYELLAAHLGEQINLYTGERYVFTADHVGVLRELDVEVTRPERYFLLVQTGDETLDYRQAVAKFAASRQLIEPGGSHGFDGFERHLPDIVQFLGEHAQ